MIEPHIMEETVTDLEVYSLIPIAFEVRTILDVQVVDWGLGGFVMRERTIGTPYVKDYDALEGGPARWAKRWDISKWGVISASLNTSRVGGCVVAHDTPGVHKLEGRKDIAALWDLRVHPDHRRTGIGSRLFAAALKWTEERGCRILKVETQNINVPACRFYAKLGCVLGSVNRYAYREFPEEVELVWYKEL
jgi:GNAT superfamily N-acetyltransferase